MVKGALKAMKKRGERAQLRAGSRSPRRKCQSGCSLQGAEARRGKGRNFKLGLYIVLPMVSQLQPAG